MTSPNTNYGIGSVHDHKKELLEELLPRIERESRMDMARDPSQEAMDKEIAYRKGLETSAVAKMSQDEALVTRQTGIKASDYLANK